MKINFIGGGLIKSGGMRIIFEYANRLKYLGHDVIYYYPVKPLFYKKEKLLNRFKQYYWNLLEFKNRDRIKSKYFKHKFKINIVPFLNNIFIRNADVTIATQWPTSYMLMNLSSKKGKKVYFIQDYETWNSDNVLVDNSYKLPVSRITISLYLYQYFKTKFDSDSVIILNGIDFDKFKYNIKPKRKKIVISFIAHNLEKKGTKDAIKIVSQIYSKYKDIEVISFGLQNYHNLPEYIKFIENPNEDQIADLYSQSDIFLFTSLIEGFGLPPAEAMASGCAVVSTIVGAVPDYSTHLFSAMHFNPGDTDNAINNIRYLIENRTEMLRLSQNAIREVRNKLNWDISVSKFEKMLIEL